MVESVERMDEMVKDYLLFRGMTNTFKAFETDLKNDKDRSFRADKIKEQILQYIQMYDLIGLRSLWKHLERRIFCHLEHSHYTNVRRIEVSLLRLYVINAVQSGRTEKVSEFFDKMCYEIQTQAEWKEWFSLPFMKNPEQNQTFETYFSKQWQDTLLFSLQNFLSVIFQIISSIDFLAEYEFVFNYIDPPLPTLLNFDAEQMHMKSLVEENRRLLDQLAGYEKPKTSDEVDSLIPLPLSTTEIPDDFASVAGGYQVRDFGTKPILSRGAIRRSPLAQRKQPASHAEKNAKNTPGNNLSKSVGFVPNTKSSDKRILNTILGPRKGGDASSSKPKDTSGKKIDPPSVMQTNTTTAPAITSQPRQTVNKNYEAQRKELFQKSTVMPPKATKMPVARTVQDSSIGLTDTTQWQLQPESEGSTAPQSGVTIKLEKRSRTTPSSDEYTEHHSSITHCKFSPSATSVATMDIDGVVKIWSFTPMPRTIATVMFKAPLLSMEWVPKQPRMLLLGSSEGTLKVYDTEQKKLMSDVNVDPSCPKKVWGQSRQIKEPSTTLGYQGHETKGDFIVSDIDTCINSMAFNHNGNMMISGAADGTLRLFDVNSCNCILSWKSHKGPVHAVNFSPDETSVFSMGADGKFCKWALVNPGQQVDFSIHNGATGPFVLSGYGGYSQQQSPRGRLFAFDSSGQYILTCAPYGGIIYKLSKSGDLDQMLTILGHRTPVVSVDWSTSVNTGMCLTGSMDGKVQITTLLSQ
ncbi:putative WD repeat-containing protein 91 [Apostichopus japonicus]|uniref:WD repeat-containing protein 91 n=1 Tax=Stichopus japonicus TaxID=307972 RepID=A0A2G8L593_STIJA|nr:putative WD repeat-containing protein 91 [Apostichopus japonicus]